MTVKQRLIWTLGQYGTVHLTTMIYPLLVVCIFLADQKFTNFFFFLLQLNFIVFSDWGAGPSKTDLHSPSFIDDETSNAIHNFPHEINFNFPSSKITDQAYYSILISSCIHN